MDHRGPSPGIAPGGIRVPGWLIAALLAAILALLATDIRAATLPGRALARPATPVSFGMS